jgi:flagellar basal-body rod protein FlgG
MDRGLHIAASGMLAEQLRQDQLANDLANASTPGYKPDRLSQQAFGDLVLVNSRTGAVVGAVGLGTAIGAVEIDLSQAALRETGEPLDVALVGPGFLAVQTSAGVKYTRNGQLTIDPQGRLVTATGLPVLDESGKPIEVGSREDLTIGSDGTIRSGKKVVAKLALFTLEGAQKIGDSLYAGKAAKDTTTEVKQGWLEGSGVSAARAMVDMIVSLRAFESAQRVIRTIDETLGRGISAGSPGSG